MLNHWRKLRQCAALHLELSSSLHLCRPTTEFGGPPIIKGISRTTPQIEFLPSPSSPPSLHPQLIAIAALPKKHSSNDTQCSDQVPFCAIATGETSHQAPNLQARHNSCSPAWHAVLLLGPQLAPPSTAALHTVLIQQGTGTRCCQREIVLPTKCCACTFTARSNVELCQSAPPAPDPAKSCIIDPTESCTGHWSQTLQPCSLHTIVCNQCTRPNSFSWQFFVGSTSAPLICHCCGALHKTTK